MYYFNDLKMPRGNGHDSQDPLYKNSVMQPFVDANSWGYCNSVIHQDDLITWIGGCLDQKGFMQKEGG